VGHNLDRRPLVPRDAGDWAALLTAIQDADADSLTDAVRLYERVGFTVALTWTAYRKRLA
jgi:hypothetical protein